MGWRPTPWGLTKLLLFYSAWCLAPLLPILSVILALRGDFRLGVFLITHAAYRQIVPGGTWEWMRQALNLEKTPYYRSCKVFEGGELTDGDRTLLAFHPHGILCCGWTNAVVSEAMRRAKVMWLVADALFLFPFIREMLRWCNTRAVNAPHMRLCMRREQNIALLPGGFEEATLFRKGHCRVFIKQRAGFIKLALEAGYAVRPAFCFGEEQTFQAFPGLLALRLALNRLKVPAVAFFGVWWLPPYMPDPDIELAVVVGPPLRLPKIENPTREDIAAWHAKYIEELRGLFERNKGKYGCAGKELEVF